MYGVIGMSASSLHRESTDSLIYYVTYDKIGFTWLGDVNEKLCQLEKFSDTNELCCHTSANTSGQRYISKAGISICYSGCVHRDIKY